MADRRLDLTLLVRDGEQGGLPEAPDLAVWPFLDAAVRCVERFGWSRTTVRDVAREAGVERTTVYRRVGSMPQIFRLIVARELHHILGGLPTFVQDGADGPEMVVDLLAAAIEHSAAHPVLARVLTDEPELIASFLTAGLTQLLDRVTVTVAPVIAAAMDAGLLAGGDPAATTQWLARIGLSVLVAPPPGDLRAFLRHGIAPLLAPAAGPPATDERSSAP